MVIEVLKRLLDPDSIRYRHLVREINSYVDRLNRIALETLFPYLSKLEETKGWEILKYLNFSEGLAGELSVFAALRYQNKNKQVEAIYFKGENPRQLEGGWPYCQDDRKGVSYQNLIEKLTSLEELVCQLDDPFNQQLEVVEFGTSLNWKTVFLRHFECRQYLPRPLGMELIQSNILAIQMVSPDHVGIGAGSEYSFDIGLGRRRIDKDERLFVGINPDKLKDCLTGKAFEMYQMICANGQRSVCYIFRCEPAGKEHFSK